MWWIYTSASSLQELLLELKIKMTSTNMIVMRCHLEKFMSRRRCLCCKETWIFLPLSSSQLMINDDNQHFGHIYPILLLQLSNQGKIQWILFKCFQWLWLWIWWWNLVGVCWDRRPAGGEQVVGGGHVPWDDCEDEVKDDNGGCRFHKKKKQKRS